MHIILKNLVNEIKCSVDSHMTIQRLRQLIKKEFGIDEDTYEIFFENKILSNGKSKLKDFNILEGSVIIIYFKINKVVADVTLPNDEIKTVEADINDTVAEFKRKIEQISNVVADSQDLVYNGNVMEDDKKLSDYRISVRCAISVIPKKMEDNHCLILRENENEFCILHVNKNTCLSDLKEKINKETGIDMSAARIRLKNRTLKDTENLATAGVKNAYTSLGIVGATMVIFVDLPNGNRLEMNVVPSLQISLLKRKIEELQPLFEARDHLLLFKGLYLKNINQTLLDYQVVNNSVLHYIATKKGPIHIIVKSWDNRSFTFPVYVMQKVSDLKEQICRLMGIRTEEQMLTFLDRILEDEKCLEFFRLVEKSVISLSIRIFGGSEIDI